MKTYAGWFWLWVSMRTVVWTCAVTWTQPNAPLDLLEWTAWGRCMTWGYPKHPPLAAWIAGAFAHLSPGDIWGVYIAGFLLAAVCLWAAWQMAREFLPPAPALAAAICLDGLLYLTGDAAEFNNMVVLDAAWALTALFFVRAIKTAELRWWLATGIATGLGLLSKYSMGMLLIPMMLFMFRDRNARHQLARPGPWLAVLVSLVLFAPHAMWLVQHHFITFQYAVSRSADSRWFGHVTNPTLFLGAQLLKLLPVVAVIVPMMGRNRSSLPAQNRMLLDCVAWWPMVFILAISALTGCQLRDIWGSPFLTFTGVWLLAYCGSFSPDALRKSRIAWACVAVTMLVICTGKGLAVPYLFHRPTRVIYPGRQLAAEVTRRWHLYSTNPLPVVGGEAWRTDNVCCYSVDQPLGYTSGEMGDFVFEPEHSPWTSDADMKARGGVLLWDAGTMGDGLPLEAQKRFPQAVVEPPVILGYQTRASIPADRIGVAFVLPATDTRGSR